MAYRIAPDYDPRIKELINLQEMWAFSRDLRAILCFLPVQHSYYSFFDKELWDVDDKMHNLFCALKESLNARPNLFVAEHLHDWEQRSMAEVHQAAAQDLLWCRHRVLNIVPAVRHLATRPNAPIVLPADEFEIEWTEAYSDLNLDAA